MGRQPSRIGRAIGLVAALAVAACGGEESGLRLQVGEIDRSATLRDDAMTVRVRRASGQEVSVAVRSPGSGAPLARAGSRRLGDDDETVTVRLTESGRARVADCGTRAVEVVLTRGGRRVQRAGARLSDAGPPCGRFFAPDAVWNRPLRADAALDPASARLVAELRRQVEANYDARFGPDINTSDYSTRVYTAAADQPTVQVALPPEKRFAGAPFAAVPLPDDARPAKGTDQHLVLWQPGTDTLWEFYGLQRAGDGAGWRADWGGRLEAVSRSDGRFRPTDRGVKYGATATGLSLAGGLITPGDLARGRIDHALAFAIPRARAGTWTAPAQRTDGIRPGPDAIPEGAHFRIDPRADLGALDLPPLTRMMAEAVQRYGMVLRDQSAVVTFYAQTLLDGPNVALGRLKEGRLSSEVLRPFPWDRLQLLEMTLSP